MENSQENNGRQHIVTPHLDDDLHQIARWARDDLFKTCKFLYRGKAELQSTGDVYQAFEKDCMNSLPGVKAAQAMGGVPPHKDIYVKILWDMANVRHIISQSLSLRRSCVYTVMQNRFDDLCEQCVTHNLIFPALEAFEQRLQNPTNYYLFYEYFLRAAVGEGDWKKNTGHHKKKTTRLSSTTTTIDPTTTKTRMATSLDEAFALVVFKNNYFAWLLEAKQKHKNTPLMTDYDSQVSISGKSTLAEYLLQGSVVNLDAENEDRDFVIWKKPAVGEGSGGIHSADHEYQEAFENYYGMVNSIRSKVMNSVEYQRLTDAMTLLQATGNEHEESETARKKKRRRVLREMKTYTGARKGQEKAFRGWSERAFVELVESKKAIIADKVLNKRFGKAYKCLYAVQRMETLALEPSTSNHAALLDDDQYKQLYNADDDSD